MLVSMRVMVFSERVRIKREQHCNGPDEWIDTEACNYRAGYSRCESSGDSLDGK